MARRALRKRSSTRALMMDAYARTYLLAGSHMRLIILSRVSLPPSLRAFVIDLMPCSLLAYSRSPPSRWFKARSRCL